MLSSKEELKFFKTEQVLRFFKINNATTIYLTNSRIIFEEEEETDVFPLCSLIRIAKKYNKYKFYFPYFKVKKLRLDDNLPVQFQEKTREIFDYIMRFKLHLYLYKTPSYKQENSYYNELRLLIKESKSEFEDEMGKMILPEHLKCIEMETTVKLYKQMFLLITTKAIQDKINSYVKNDHFGEKNKKISLSYKMDGKGLLLRRGQTELKGHLRNFENSIESSLIQIFFPNNTSVKRTLIVLTKNRENLNEYKLALSKIYNVVGFSIKYLIVNCKKYKDFNDKNRKLQIINDLSFGIVYIKKIIINACKTINEGDIVVIEDTSKFEITHILCTLIKMFSHSYYRTLEGFMLLIKREWLNYGFDFNKDLEYVNEIADNNQSIFILMLLTVYSMINFSPDCFEFNGNIIAFLMHHCSSGYYFPFAPICYYAQEFQKNENIFKVILKEPQSFINNTFMYTLKLTEEIKKDQLNYNKYNSDSVYDEMDQSRIRRCLKNIMSNIYEYYNKNVLSDEIQTERKSWKFYEE